MASRPQGSQLHSLCCSVPSCFHTAGACGPGPATLACSGAFEVCGVVKQSNTVDIHAHTHLASSSTPFLLLSRPLPESLLLQWLRPSSPAQTSRGQLPRQVSFPFRCAALWCPLQFVLRIASSPLLLESRGLPRPRTASCVLCLSCVCILCPVSVLCLHSVSCVCPLSSVLCLCPVSVLCLCPVSVLCLSCVFCSVSCVRKHL